MYTVIVMQEDSVVAFANATAFNLENKTLTVNSMLVTKTEQNILKNDILNFCLIDSNGIPQFTFTKCINDLDLLDKDLFYKTITFKAQSVLNEFGSDIGV